MWDEVGVALDFACVGRTHLSVAFELDVDLDLDDDREGHGFSRAEKLPIKSTRLQALRAHMRGMR